MAERATAWLTARPVAHRGLHDAAAGVIENTSSAFAAAIAGNFAIECDVQLSADDEAMVHHDFALGRLIEGTGLIAEHSVAALQAMPFRQTTDRMQTLAQLCAQVGGKVPLIVEIKSRFDGDMKLARRTGEMLSGYAGHAAAMSFDPAVVTFLRENFPAITRGIVAEAHYDHGEWRKMSAAQRWQLALLAHAPSTRPHFVAYAVRDLPAPGPLVARYVFGLPLLTWTVRTPAERATAARHADQMIFEAFRP